MIKQSNKVIQLKLEAINKRYREIQEGIKLFEKDCKEILTRAFKEDGSIDDEIYGAFLDYLIENKPRVEVCRTELEMLSELHTEYYLTLPVK